MGNEEQAAELLEAIEQGNAESVASLLAAMPKLAGARNDQGVSAVMVALYHRQDELARILLDAGHAPDAFECAALGETEALAALLDSDASTQSALSAHSADGFTLLHLACFFNHPDTARLLITRGSDVNAVADNPTHVAPLHSAAAGGGAEIVAMLLEHGAHPDAQQHGGFTALMAAAMHGNPDMVETLLAGGASTAIAADDGHTSIDFARKAGHDELVKRLEDT